MESEKRDVDIYSSPRIYQSEFEKGDIFEAITKIMAEMDAVKKTQKNVQQGFMFRGIDDVYNALQKLMAKHGVFTTTKIINRQRHEVTSQAGNKGYHILNQYRFRFFGKDGSYFDCFADGEGIDYGDKGSNKCAAIAHKYALIQVFAIPTGNGDDPDREAHEIRPGGGSSYHPSSGKSKKVTDPQIKRLYKIMDGSGYNMGEIREMVFEQYGKESLDEMTMAEYDTVCKVVQLGKPK